VSIKTPVPQSTDSPAQIPNRIGAWEIQGVLGRGASATIYLGRELFPARDVAIKVYDPPRLSPEDRKLFRSLFLIGLSLFCVAARATCRCK